MGENKAKRGEITKMAQEIQIKVVLKITESQLSVLAILCHSVF